MWQIRKNNFRVFNKDKKNRLKKKYILPADLSHFPGFSALGANNSGGTKGTFPGFVLLVPL